MKKKTKILLGLLIFFLLLAIVIPVVFYFISIAQKPIEIVNNSKYYRVDHHTSREFNEYLDKWDFWGRDKVYLGTHGKKYTVKKIKIYLTDTRQPYYEIRLSDGTVFGSSMSENVDDRGTLILKIYMNPEVISVKNQEYLTNLFLFSVVSRLYAISHANQLDQEKFLQIGQVYSYFSNKKHNNPFFLKKR